jgi:hypothetical protein
MTTMLITAMATACILTAVEGLLITLGKFRGLLALVLSFSFCYILEVPLKQLAVYSLAATFAGLTLSLIVEQLFSEPAGRRLPNRVESRDLPKRF